MKSKPGSDDVRLSLVALGAWVIVGAGAFHLAYVLDSLGGLVLLYLFALVRLAGAATWRRAFYPGLVMGLLIAAGRLDFFWRIFSGGAIGLWIVYALWIGMFVAVARLFLRRWPRWGWVLVPVAWCALEYFRSELYYLRFAWLSPGFGLNGSVWAVLQVAGVYGFGFLGAGVACMAAWLWQRHRVRAGVLLLGAMVLVGWGNTRRDTGPPIPVRRGVCITGVQMEFPAENEVLLSLNATLKKHPETQLFVLSEYTFSGPVPDRIKAWCRDHRVYLIVGGQAPAGVNYYNTAFVISPDGEVVFSQAKSVPIQFFKDGLPALNQELWNSPWGKVGICICYDLSYTRVTDRFVRQGAELLVVPTMDVADWGIRQHQLHARVAPVRAAEYGIPIFRLASSGISQVVDRRGSVLVSAPCPGDGAVLSGMVELGREGHLPLDRWLAPACVAVTGVTLAWLLLSSILPKRQIRA